MEEKGKRKERNDRAIRDAKCNRVGGDDLWVGEVSPKQLTTQKCWHRIAQAGGYLGRKGDGEPGWKTLWKGWLYIQTLLEGISLASQLLLE